MRIVSLVPAATEMLFALGLGDDVVGVTHECDYPAAARDLPKVTKSSLAEDLSAAEVDAVVKARALAGESIYELDGDALAALAPDLIVTQALCSVCAVSYEEVRSLAESIESLPMVIALDPHTLGEVLGDYRTLGRATATTDEAVDLIRESTERIDRVRTTVRGARRRPRVVALEWLDPPYVAGHWTPQMIEFAGGEDVLGFTGEESTQTTWELIRAAEPDIIIVMPCGYGAEIAHREAEMHRPQLEDLGADRIVAVDAAAFFSRPGPRLIDGLELLAHIIHPQLIGDPLEPSARALAVEFD